MKLYSIALLTLFFAGCQNPKTVTSTGNSKDIDALEQLLFSKRDSLKSSPEGFHKKTEQLQKLYRTNSDSLIHAKLDFLQASYLNWEQEDSLSQLYFKKSIPVLKRHEKQVKLMLIDGLFRQGAYYYKSYDYETARQFLKQSVYYAEKYIAKDSLTTKASILTFGAYGSVNRVLNNHDIAITYLTKTITLCTSQSSLKSKLTAYTDLALVYNDLQKFSEALDCNKKAEALALEFYPERLPLVYNHYASIYYDRKDWNNVLFYLKKEYAANPDTELYVQALNFSGTYLNLKKLDLAKPYIDFIEKEYEAGNIPEFDLPQTLERLPEYYIAVNNKEKANRYLRAYIIAQKKFYDTEKVTITEDLVKKYDLKEKQDKIELLDQKNKLVQAKLERKNTTLYISLLAFLLLLALALTLYFQQRNRKLEVDKKLLIMEDTLLRSQMEPHFVFNALSSLQGLIYENKNQLAVKYLSKFARLLRLSLEHSRMKFVAFPDEIESLENYLELQKMRFNNKFDYTITGDRKEMEYFSIPPLMIQPFVENVIYHGFSSIDYQGKLQITYQKHPDYIRFTIEDNGLGVEASKVNSNKTKTSLSTTITIERLKSLMENKKKIDFISISNNPSEKSGTTVILKMPYIPTH